MRISWKKHSFIVSLLVVALCSGLAARAFGLYLSTTWTPDAASRLQSQQQHHALPDRARDVTAIITRNPFCSTCAPNPAALRFEEGLTTQHTPAFAVPDNLRLIVTLISEEPGWSFAAIRDTEEGRTSLHTIDSVVPGGARVAAIQDRHVVLAKDGQEGVLSLQSTGAAHTKAKPKPRPRSGGLPAAVVAGIRQTKPGHFEIQRGALNKLLNNTMLVARSGRVVPLVQEGRSRGFSLSRLRRGGIYQLLGFENGDNIHAVNGRAITGPDSVLPIYRNLRRASHLTISYTRRGKTLTHDYSIR